MRGRLPRFASCVAGAGACGYALHMHLGSYSGCLADVAGCSSPVRTRMIAIGGALGLLTLWWVIAAPYEALRPLAGPLRGARTPRRR